MHLSSKHLFEVIVIALLCAVGVCGSLFGYYEWRQATQLYSGIVEKMIASRVDGVFATINSFPSSAGKDVTYLRQSAAVSTLVQTENNTQSTTRAKEDIAAFMATHSAYRTILVDVPKSHCMRVITEVATSTGVCLPYDTVVQQTLTETATLPLGSVYISHLLNYGGIPGVTSSSTESTPSLVYASTVSLGTATSTVLAVVNADYFLEEVRRLSRPDEAVYLVRQDGSYIANVERSKEFLSGGVATLYSDYPELPAGALMDQTVEKYVADGQLFTIKRIVPSISNFVLYDAHAANSSSDYWALVIVSTLSDTITKHIERDK